MSRIDALLAQLAPNGVEFKTLGEVVQIASARADVALLDATTYVGVDNLLPNFGGRRDSGYGANSSGAIKFEPGNILIGNIRPYLKKVWLADRGGGASPDVLTLSLLPKWRGAILPRFLYFVIASEPFIAYSMQHAQGAKMPRGNKAATLKFPLPIPPLEVQREIVRILDKFTELEAELEARRLQYAHCRDHLLSFREAGGVRWIRMGEAGTFERGRRFTRGDVVDGGIPSIHYGEIYTHYGVATSRSIRQVRESLRPQLRFALPGDVVIASVGETVEDVGKAVAWLGNGPVTIHDDTFRFRHSLSPKFVSYWMQTEAFHSQKTRHVASAKIKRLSSSALASILMPVPPMEKQLRVVEVLDKFDALVDDLSIGLPAELAARRKQYEYYRDKLLTFEELV